MEPGAEKTSRKPRADSLRNRERLLRAAHAVFGEGGSEASLEAVARHAGVGIGTLYRHFPTREALFQAVYRNEVDDLVALAARLADDPDPAEALRQWLHAQAGVVATKRGMLAALAPAPESARQLYADSRARTIAAIDGLMRRAQAAGAIRPDLGAEEVLHALIGICYARDHPDWQRSTARLLDVLVDGLRPRAG